MTRETTIGLVVSCSFLCLVGVVIVTKMRPGTGPTPHPDTLAEADVAVPPAPTPVTPPGPPATPWGGAGSPSPVVSPGSPNITAGGSGPQILEPLGSKPPGLQRVPSEGPDAVVLAGATSSEPDPK